MQGKLKWSCCAGLLAALAVGFVNQIPTEHVSLAWDASPDTNVIGYFLKWGTNHGAYSWHLDAGTNLTATVRGLSPGMRYYFVATAYDAQKDESAASNEVQWFALKTSNW